MRNTNNHPSVCREDDSIRLLRCSKLETAGSLVKRGGLALLATTAVLASLLVFPSALPWMVCAWIVLHTFIAQRGGRSWLPLLICCAVIVVKRTGWPVSLLALAFMMVAIAIGRAVYIDKTAPPRWQLTWACISALWVVWTWFALDWTGAARSKGGRQLNPSRPLVCIGDSLTSFGYPEVLSEKITVPVVNLGAEGISTADALELISELKSANPQAVVIELGGHDFLEGRSRSETARDLVKIIDACHSVGASAILMEIPRGFITDAFSGLERQLARQYDLELIPDTAIRNLVLWSNYSPPGMWFDSSTHLSDDGLHPNNQGNEYLANRVVDALIRIYGAKIVQKGE